MITLCDKKQCTGCAACIQACPRECISYEEDSEGFYYPHIDNNNCVACGKCLSVCPVINRPDIDLLDNSKVYAIYSSNQQILTKATSGGIFSQIAHVLIKNGYVVYGTAFDQKWNLKCTRAENEEQLDKLVGSKYVQAFPNAVYKSIKMDLSKGTRVYYCGTPCQIAGLYAFLGKDTDGLITSDIVCHGVPSNKLWRAYIEYLKNKGINITSYSFRDKSKWGWGSWGSYTYIKNNTQRKHYFPVAADYYYSLFFKENCLRESCYKCEFNGLKRLSDFTIGDYWGIDNAHPNFYNRNGVSVVFLNTDKAVKLFADNVNNFVYIESTSKLATSGNKTIIESTKRPDSRNQLYKDLETIGFEKTAKKYVHIRRIIPYISRYIPRGFKKKLSKKIPKLSRKMVDS